MRETHQLALLPSHGPADARIDLEVLLLTRARSRARRAQTGPTDVGLAACLRAYVDSERLGSLHHDRTRIRGGVVSASWAGKRYKRGEVADAPGQAAHLLRCDEGRVERRRQVRERRLQRQEPDCEKGHAGERERVLMVECWRESGVSASAQPGARPRARTNSTGPNRQYAAGGWKAACWNRDRDSG